MTDQFREERAENGQFLPGNRLGRKKGVPNRATADMKTRARELLSRPEYLRKLKQRLIQGTCPAGVEILLYYYAYGRPKETVQMEGESRQPFQIVFTGPRRDPLETPEPIEDPTDRHRPALPVPMPEIGFNMTLADLDEP